MYAASKPKLLDAFKLQLASLTDVSMVQPLLRLFFTIAYCLVRLNEYSLH